MKPKSSSHKSQTLCLLVAVTTALGAIAAGIPAPPWAARHRGPTSNLEVVTYAAQVRPLLPEDVRMKLDAASNAAPAEIAALLYEARLRPAVALPDVYKAPNAPWLMAAVTNSAERIAALKRMYGDQWQPLNSNGASFTAVSVAAMMTVQRDLEELERRIGDTSDTLDDLGRYSTVFRVDGAAMSLFWHAQQLYWKKDQVRCENLLKFLVRPENGSGFVVGSAHYHLGAALHRWHQDYSNAFVHYMMVHKYPACLVFTAHAYIGAAQVLRDLRFPIVYTEALMAVDVPCVGFLRIRAERHYRLAEYCRDRREWRGMVRHLQVAVLSDGSYGVPAQQMLETHVPGESASLWKVQATNAWTQADTMALVTAALAAPRKTPHDDLYLDALAHDWPSITEIPADIVTNRLLSNNILPDRRLRVETFRTRQ